MIFFSPPYLYHLHAQLQPLPLDYLRDHQRHPSRLMMSHDLNLPDDLLIAALVMDEEYLSFLSLQLLAVVLVVVTAKKEIVAVEVD